EQRLSTRTVLQLHNVLSGCLKAAVRKGLLAASPVARAEVPSPGDSDRGVVLDADQLRTLVNGFKGSALFPFVAAAAFTGARRNEVLGLGWEDLDVARKTLRIERALEETEKFGLAYKELKSPRHKRTIIIDDDLLALLLAERDTHLRIAAGVPDGAAVD